MKGGLKRAHSDWMRLHQGKRISIYDIPGLTKGPYERRFTVDDIKAAFAACGLHPFNRFAIPEYDFAPAHVTDLNAVPQPVEATPADAQETVPQTTSIQQDEFIQEKVLRLLNPTGNIDMSIQLQPSISSSQGTLVSRYLLTYDSTGTATIVPFIVPCTTETPPATATINEASDISHTSTSVLLSLSDISLQSVVDQVVCQSQSTPDPPHHIAAPRRHVSPEEVLPHPRVDQTGPRNPRAKNRGSSRVLTDDNELQIIKETHDAKVAKDKKPILKEFNKTNALKENKRLLKENSKLQKITEGKCIEVKRKSNKSVSKTSKENDPCPITPISSSVQRKRNVQKEDGDSNSPDVAYIPPRTFDYPSVQLQRKRSEVKKTIRYSTVP